MAGAFSSTQIHKYILILLLVVMVGITASSVLGLYTNMSPPRSLSSSLYEGYTGLGSKNNPLATGVLSAYNISTSLYNVYGNVYYDPNNGNLIEAVYSAGTNSSSTTGNVSGVVQQIIIHSRDQSSSVANEAVYSAVDSNGNALAQNVSESQSTSIYSTSGCFAIMTTSSFLEVVYVAFNSDTYLHIIDLTTQQPVFVFSVYFQNAAATNGYYQWPTNQPQLYPSYLGNTTSADGTYVVDQYYDASSWLLQLSQYAKYDTSNGNFIVQTSTSPHLIRIYTRTGGGHFSTSTGTAIEDASYNTVSSTGHTTDSLISSLSNTATQPMLIQDPLGTNLYIYWPIMNKTVIVQLQAVYSTTYGIPAQSFVLLNGSMTSFTAPSYGSGSSSSSNSNFTNDFNNYSNSSVTDIDSKWYWYWRLNGLSDMALYNNDYILKTQVVPPVCPSCPATGAAAGSNNNNGSRSNRLSSELTNDVNGIGTLASDSIRGTGSLIKDSVEGTGSFVKDTAEGTGSFVKNSVQGTGSFVKDSAEGAGSFVKDSIQGTGSFVKDSIQDTASTGKQAVGAVWHELTEPGPGFGNNVGGDQTYRTSSAAAGNNTTNAQQQQQQYKLDYYSYNGQLGGGSGASAGGGVDPMPVTADFSKFGR